MSFWRRILGPRRRFGYLPDQGDPTVKSAAEDWDILSLGLNTAPPDFTMEALVPEVLDQSISQSCTGMATAIALTAAMRFSLGTAPLVSPRWLYWVGRRWHGGEGRDVGSYLRTVLKAAQKVGFCPESGEGGMPFDAGLINQAPPVKAMMRAYDQRGLRGYYRITATDLETRLDELKRASASGRPAVFGMWVDRAFTRDTGPNTIAPMSERFGRHAMCMLGYNQDDLVRVRNSWRRSWRDGGSCWMDPECVADWDDIWIVDPKKVPHYA